MLGHADPSSDDAELLELEAEARLAEAEAAAAHQRVQCKREEEGRHVASLRHKEAEVQRLKSEAASLQRRVEEEEEYIANGLLKRLDVLKCEKESLAQQVEVEEEFLVNSLQKQLSQLSSEKDDLEKHLHRERKFIVTKLRKQLRQAMDQKRSLEKIVRADGNNLLIHVQQYKAALSDTDPNDSDAASTQQAPQPQQHPAAGSDRHHPGTPSGRPSAQPAPTTPAAPGQREGRQGSFLTVSYDSDSSSTFSTYSESTQRSGGACSTGLHFDATMRKLQKEVLRLQQVCSSNASSAEVTAEKCDALRQELERLSQDNFLKEVKAIRLREELNRASGERHRFLVKSETLSESEVTIDMRNRRRMSTSSNPKHLKAHTEHILTRPPSSPLSMQPSVVPVSWGTATPPLTPCLSPRSISSGTSTPTQLPGSVPRGAVAFLGGFRRDVSSSSECSSRAPSETRRGQVQQQQQQQHPLRKG